MVFYFLQFAAILLLTLGATFLLGRVMKSKGFKVKQTANCLIMTLVTISLFLLGLNDPVWVLRGIVFALILLYASVQDLTFREADDFLWVMILILAIGSIGTVPVWSMLLGAAVVFVPQMAIAMFSKKGGIGGADIKLSTAAALLLGFFPGAIGYVAGLAFAILFTLIYNKIKHRTNQKSFPLIPFLSVGLMIGYLI